ncbi:acyltransferase family protein [Methylomonas methanica]|uniref:Acyltransferase 3 n=1 Tax=Methylomonas methanica (strain DSM 25384 / MC09) TaxID=857087 RepID=G0A753_METMM|nr:acyltransferase [Methylomonas methanica]AEG01847.1 acyltransferase 3 [Methylomonas methanica MC09]
MNNQHILPHKSVKMASIEGARAFAALAVALMHCANAMRVEHFSGHVGLGSIFDFGYIGVDFFFVLSGFIITYVHFHEFGHIEKIPRYLWRRFSRIYPIYWTFLLIAIGVTTLGRLANGKGLIFEMTLADIPGTIFLLISSGEPKYIGPAWSLQYEIVFYVVFSWLLLGGRLGAIIFGCWGAFLLAHTLGLWQFNLPFHLSNAHCMQFLLGVAVAVLARRYKLHATKTLLFAVMLVFIAGVVFEVYGPLARHSGIGRLVLGFTSAMVLATLVGLENAKALQTPNWLVRMGSVSYSIYLGHILFINLTFAILLKLGLYHTLPETLVFAIGLSVALASTIMIGLWVEMPLVSKLKDFGKNRNQ